VGGLPTTKKGYYYVFFVVDRFRKMGILIPCKNTINGKEEANKFFERFWVHFGIPRCIIAYRDTRFLSAFWTTLWDNIDDKLKRSISFHP
jgi:hypothetical protein